MAEHWDWSEPLEGEEEEEGVGEEPPPPLTNQGEEVEGAGQRSS